MFPGHLGAKDVEFKATTRLRLHESEETSPLARSVARPMAALAPRGGALRILTPDFPAF
jgi:hypothetical protein